ncbi:threonine-phosphate decarboxylase CobD [Pseudomonas sp. LS44]|uniref:threonine-phosphate decarboxylase CobD n=1 Tax=Pseudomonas sp. LS44 TaxID=1357074 RepID=UPI00215B50C9|nr:threonine-phosphate decarboxylase CobD [Pseudomonas sp. LS44]UVE16535.1 threonine-phosphate decarboxylase CobD [Pseudomonas sp. LS44]
MLEHGGRLKAAARQYGIAEADWLDLSTGIAPWPFDLPALATQTWARLPEVDDGLDAAACSYYGVEQLLAVPGSQAAIQLLPRLRPSGRVGVLAPCYAEHAEAWRKAGHEVIELAADGLEEALPRLDVLVLVNPNNPTGQRFDQALLLDWHARLARHGGWLVVDEAFIDCTSALSLAASAGEGLIVLRSFGKFFGLAGARLGFVLADAKLLAALAEQLGPWAISGPTRAVGQACLRDRGAQLAQRQRAEAACARLAELLVGQGWAPQGGCALFQYRVDPRAAQLHDFLARRGILVRLFTQPIALRFGLPKGESDWQRLEQALADFGRSEFIRDPQPQAIPTIADESAPTDESEH